jgi:type II secretory pathway predicted ATPase ExeA
MSYIDHFKLNEQPFRLTPDPAFVYWSKQHARAKAYMESTIWLADGFVVITGEIGSGKTTLLQSFLTELQKDFVFAVVSQTQLTTTQFLQAVLTEFGFKPFDKRKVELLDMLNMFLIEQYANGKKVVLIVDEAQNLSKKVLEEVRMLSGIALDKSEMQEYIVHRLKVAGRAADDLFDPGCYKIIRQYAGGVPRLINTLCDTALLCAFADEKDVVRATDIVAAVQELGWEEHEGNTGIFGTIRNIAFGQTADSHVTRIEIQTAGETVAVQSFPHGRAIVGRSPDNEIYIKSKFVSRHHAQLISDERGCVVEDLNSTNGVFVADKQIKKRRLHDGDIVSLGIHQLVYHDLREAAPKGGNADEASSAGTR